MDVIYDDGPDGPAVVCDFTVSFFLVNSMLILLCIFRFDCGMPE